MREPVVRPLGPVQVRRPDPPPAQEKVVADHDAHKRGEEYGEGAEHRDEGGCAVDQLPPLDDPCRGERDYGAAADVDVPGDDAGEVDAPGDGVAAEVLEEHGKGEGQS